MCNACDAKFMQVMRSLHGRRDVLRGIGSGFVAAAVSANGVMDASAADTRKAEAIFLARRIYTMDAV